jgi:hypothetical protein
VTAGFDSLDKLGADIAPTGSIVAVAQPALILLLGLGYLVASFFVWAVPPCAARNRVGACYQSHCPGSRHSLSARERRRGGTADGSLRRWPIGRG